MVPAFARAGADIIALGSSPMSETQARIEMLGRSYLKIHDLADPSGLAEGVEAPPDDGGHTDLLFIKVGQICQRASTVATRYVTSQSPVIDGGWLSC
ncbi:Rossmann-fold NAD(P)-binding domain-containing protein [Agrobacterium tumefaciens]|uniref:hypothetical protein n=1 Tax=Agrobacterium tumefaciens TaxID=358 RepID=UPI0009776180|nr:hypothetical protein BV900_28150 [Agrobacterium tumefaciens]